MKISDLLKMGLRNLFRRKARTALTIIGMVIGTISIVVMVSIGIGINNVFTEAVMKDGSLSLITVYRAQKWDDSTGQGIQGVNLNDDVIEKIKQIPNVKNVSAQYARGIRFVCGKYQAYPYFQIVDFATADDFGYPKLTDGTSLTKEDSHKLILSQNDLQNFYYSMGFNSKTKVVDLTKEKVVASFQDYQPDPKKRAATFVVNENYGFFDAGEDSMYQWQSYMDIDYFKELYLKYANTLKLEDRKKAIKSLDNYDTIFVNANDIRQVSDIVKQINDLGLQAYSAMTELDPMIETANMLRTVFGAIGLVAMLVSAINIANTMIMSIYERTKEIGIMKVLGCLIRDIKKLFLFEAGLIGLIGGTIGVALSYLASWAVNKYGGPLLSSIIPGNGWLVDSSGAKFSQIPFYLPFGAVLFSIIVGVVAGYFPARRATRISAIEAMKNEN